MKVYVVTHPESVRGIYESWAACRTAVSGVKGARYQAVQSRDAAEAMLHGEGIAMSPGLYAFVDGNHLGGIGVVLVEVGVDGVHSVTETGTSVDRVFGRSPIAGLRSPPALRDALARLRNVLAELGGLYEALRLAPAGSTLVVVHDYEGVGAWLEGRWRTKDPVVAEIVAACRQLITERRLRVRFQHQRGHQSTWAGRDDFAHYNRRADALATEGGTGRGP
jgi:ribonuclease H-related protein